MLGQLCFPHSFFFSEHVCVVSSCSFLSHHFFVSRDAITLLQYTSHLPFIFSTRLENIFFCFFRMWCVLPSQHRKSNGISHWWQRTHFFYSSFIWACACIVCVVERNLVMPHIRRWRQRFLISLNSIDCINFDAKTIIYWIKINCSICILRFVPLHAAATTTAAARTTIRAQYNFYSWFWISSLSVCMCVCVCFLRSLFYSSLQLYSPTSHQLSPFAAARTPLIFSLVISLLVAILVLPIRYLSIFIERNPFCNVVFSLLLRFRLNTLVFPNTLWYYWAFLQLVSKAHGKYSIAIWNGKAIGAHEKGEKIDWKINLNVEWREKARSGMCGIYWKENFSRYFLPWNFGFVPKRTLSFLCVFQTTVYTCIICAVFLFRFRFRFGRLSRFVLRSFKYTQHTHIRFIYVFVCSKQGTERNRRERENYPLSLGWWRKMPILERTHPEKWWYACM